MELLARGLSVRDIEDAFRDESGRLLLCCLAHRMRNLAAKVPGDLWPEFKGRAIAAYQAPSRAIARDLAAGVVADYEAELPSAIACFKDDFEACTAHLRMPITHRRAIRTTDEMDGEADCCRSRASAIGCDLCSWCGVDGPAPRATP